MSVKVVSVIFLIKLFFIFCCFILKSAHVVSTKRSSLAESSASHRFISILQVCIPRINHVVWTGQTFCFCDFLHPAECEFFWDSQNCGKGIQKGWLKCEKMSEGSKSNNKEKWEFYIFKHFIENPRAAMKNRKTGQCFALTSQLFHLKGSALKEIDVCFFLVLKVFHDWSAFHLWSSTPPPAPTLLLL